MAIAVLVIVIFLFDNIKEKRSVTLKSGSECFKNPGAHHSALCGARSDITALLLDNWKRSRFVSITVITNKCKRTVLRCSNYCDVTRQ